MCPPPPPIYQKSTLKMLISRPFLKITMHHKRHLKKRTAALDPLPPRVRCVRSWKWWQFWGPAEAPIYIIHIRPRGSNGTTVKVVGLHIIRYMVITSSTPLWRAKRIGPSLYISGLEGSQVHSHRTGCPPDSTCLPSQERWGSVTLSCPGAGATRDRGSAYVASAQPTPGLTHAVAVTQKLLHIVQLSTSSCSSVSEHLQANVEHFLLFTSQWHPSEYMIWANSDTIRTTCGNTGWLDSVLHKLLAYSIQQPHEWTNRVISMIYAVSPPQTGKAFSCL